MASPIVNMISYEKQSGVRGSTKLLVLHSAECPLRGGYAQSLTNWASTPLAAGGVVASWQRFVDPISRVRFIPDDLAAWHASAANWSSIGWEQAGYARFSRAEWLTPDGLIQLENLAQDMAPEAIKYGIPMRWLSDDEVRRSLAGENIKGFCFHRQIDTATRTDPGNGYPADLLMNRIREINGQAGSTPAPVAAAPAPAAVVNGVSTRRIVSKAMYRTRPHHKAPLHESYPDGFPAGTEVTIDGYAAGSDPYLTGDNAWYRGAYSKGWIWSNNVSGGIEGLPFLATPAESAPAPAAVAAPAPAAAVLPTRTITKHETNVRTGPGTGYPPAPGFPGGLALGAVISVQGYVAGEHVNPGDNAWLKTVSGYYVWANNAGNDLSGLKFLR